MSAIGTTLDRLVLAELRLLFNVRRGLLRATYLRFEFRLQTTETDPEPPFGVLESGRSATTLTRAPKVRRCRTKGWAPGASVVQPTLKQPGVTRHDKINHERNYQPRGAQGDNIAILQQPQIVE
jgi:hypothetical protein